ncbi:bifunctional alpha,alpha-trehalose-phosphate synthase (UDP-forming)/trehalose-phosphatase [Persicitalea jodogahamensis]|uniref:Bifunctional alpha,alpha-trehalose-phosphate synthase (UDP-forming)/trehalose-phosphatase n=1 Tax=Persicitalea jodogahamensis TaxID=402147 RepID=A0A8J3GAB3_9BACT|nr:bifunctional alpha,alpha-trehalose-phosphate synthase (UDP-forming)/trehalose-phosphatase [Persicitalea jodogahamensis]GHB81540.1 bifunctional alpha,alpha-trehalose-phosphate synthase (UDP-forming)/trehalose-phosphatase [Persicitalea jodogahamensis]
MKNFTTRKKGRLIIVAYRLPFKIIKNESGTSLFQNSGGLVSAVLSLAQGSNNTSFEFEDKIQWIGYTDNTAEELEGVTLENDNFKAHPVFISQELNDNYYEGFCNDLIWPLFHYFPTIAKFETKFFEAYQEANLLFYDAMVDVIQPDDVIWIHDYQLMLLPDLIRQKFPKNKIGFFFHIPFPSFEIFRLLPSIWREAIIDGIMGADVVGFHTNDYVEYFLKAVRMVIGQGNRMHYVNLNNRLVKVDAFPISIDYKKFNDAFDDPLVIKARHDARTPLMEKVIFSVDRLDYSKGLLNRLKGYERFLEQYEEWHGRVSFVMMVVPSRDQIEQYQQMKSEIDQTVGRIGAQYGKINWQPIIYQYRSMPFEELVGLYTASDVALITPVRDGMNLVCKEYVASRKDEQGVLILSEMAGAAAELGEALIINPTDSQDIADAINKALEMEPEDQRKRMVAMQQRLREYDVFAWTNDFFTQMIMIDQEHKRLKLDYLTEEDIVSMDKAYSQAKNRLFFFDYDGTLVPIVREPEDAIVSAETKAIVAELAERDTVVVISGRDRKFLLSVLGDLPVHIVAEHGALIRKKGESEFVMNAAYKEDWKDDIRPILELYVKRCPGAFVEEKETSLAWHYRTADDHEYALRRAQELAWQLKSFIQPEQSLQIIEGNMVIEVKKTAFNKGTSAKSFVEEGDYDFILAMGDDTTDEDMFEALPESAYTVKVGDALSIAKKHIKNQFAVMELLNTFKE